MLSKIGKHNVDGYLKKIQQPACFFLTGNFFENLVLRRHIRWAADGKSLEYHHPIVKEDSNRKCMNQLLNLLLTPAVAMLWVEKDLSTAAKNLFDRWDSDKDALCYQEFVIAGARSTIGHVRKLIEQSLSLSQSHCRGVTDGYSIWPRM